MFPSSNSLFGAGVGAAATMAARAATRRSWRCMVEKFEIEWRIGSKLEEERKVFTFEKS